MATPDEQIDPGTETARELQVQTRAHRLAKLEALRARRVEPYPVRFDRDPTAAAILSSPAPSPAEVGL